MENIISPHLPESSSSGLVKFVTFQKIPKICKKSGIRYEMWQTWPFLKSFFFLFRLLPWASSSDSAVFSDPLHHLAVNYRVGQVCHISYLIPDFLQILGFFWNVFNLAIFWNLENYCWHEKITASRKITAGMRKLLLAEKLLLAWENYC